MVIVNDEKNLPKSMKVLKMVKIATEFVELLDRFCEPERRLGTKRNNYYLLPLDRPYVTSFVDFNKPYCKLLMKILKVASRLKFTYVLITHQDDTRKRK